VSKHVKFNDITGTAEIGAPCHRVDSATMQLECKSSCRIIGGFVEITTDMLNSLQAPDITCTMMSSHTPI